MVNRTQGLVLGYFLVVWVSLLVILVVTPEVYDQALSLPGGRGAELAVLAALSGLGSRMGKPSHAVGVGPDRLVVGADAGPPARPTSLVWWVASGLLRPGSPQPRRTQRAAC